MTAPDAATVAAVLSAHWDYGPTADFDGWECGCGAVISTDSTGALDEAMQAHVAAALLAAAPIAQALAAVEAVARVEALADKADARVDANHRLVTTYALRAALRPEGGNQ